MAVCQSHVRTGQRGFVLIATAISMTLLLGLAGLAIDLGRMYVIRAELQSFTDAAALTAAEDLDGDTAGLNHARASVKSLAEGPHAMRWDMGTQRITHVTTTFSSNNGIRQVKVVATEAAPVIFLRMFQSHDSSTVAAASVAVKDGARVRLTE